MTLQEPNWTAYVEMALAPQYEVELDLNARPGDPKRWRHRRRAHTGEPQSEWEYGDPPRSESQAP